MDNSKMSKRDKAKAARKSAKEAIAKGGGGGGVTSSTLAHDAGLDEAGVVEFIAGENDRVDIAERLAQRLGVALPEIEIWDYRRSGYLPEVIVNFISLLGWNPGMKRDDGKDLEKFDLAFIAAHFSLDRINKGSAKFDRAKLLAFNADAIAQLSDDAFVERWLAWMAEHEPPARRALDRLSREALVVLARALKPRSKTWRDALRPAAFALVGDAEYAFDHASVEKHLLAGDRAGLSLLRQARGGLEALAEWEPEAIAGAIDAMARERSFPNAGPIAQALRVALTGMGVSPGLGETMFVLGRESSLRRIDRCLDTVR